MFTQFLGAVATIYGVFGGLTSLLQARQMLARRTSGEVSAGGGNATSISQRLAAPDPQPHTHLA
jgi:hypothetical protein